MWQYIYGCYLIQNQDKDFFFSKLKKVFKNCQFKTFLPFHPSSAPEAFLRMSPGFIMSGGVQAIRSTCVSNSTI